MVYRKNIFGHSDDHGLYSWFLAHSSPNPGDFLSDKSNGIIFCFLSSAPETTSQEVTLVPIQGWGLVARKTNHVIRKLELLVQSPDFRGG